MELDLKTGKFVKTPSENDILGSLQKLNTEELLNYFKNHFDKMKQHFPPAPSQKIINKLHKKSCELSQKYGMPVTPKCLMKTDISIQGCELIVKKTQEQLYYDCVQRIKFEDAELDKMTEKDINVIAGFFARNIKELYLCVGNVESSICENISSKDKKEIIKYHIEWLKFNQTKN